MQRKPKNDVLTSVEKYEICKRRMLGTFISEFQKTSDPKKAYDKAKGIIKKFKDSKIITNVKQITGLYGELTYFYNFFQEQELTAEMAIGYKADFRGKIQNRPAAIDVTTNPFFKDTEEQHAKIPGKLQSGWDYYIGVVDLKNIKSKLYPLLLPLCRDDNIGFFVLVYDDQGPSAQNLYGEGSDLQYIIKYNPYCGGDEFDAIEEVVSTYNYVLGRPERVIQDIREYYTMDMDLEDIPPEIERSIEKDIEAHFNDIASFFRKLSGLTISAIVDISTEVVGYKDNIEEVTKQFWVHPHQYVRQKIGQPGEIMDYNIAAYVHDYF